MCDQICRIAEMFLSFAPYIVLAAVFWIRYFTLSVEAEQCSILGGGSGSVYIIFQADVYIFVHHMY